MPLDVILLQEIERYNVLLMEMKSNVIDLQKGIKGLVVMSSELENIFLAMLEGRVPNAWLESKCWFLLSFYLRLMCTLSA